MLVRCWPGGANLLAGVGYVLVCCLLCVLVFVMCWLTVDGVG